MILDTMTKFEVMQSLRNDFDTDVLPFFYNNITKYHALIKTKSEREHKTIFLPKIQLKSKNETEFTIKVKGNKDEYSVNFISEFVWNRRHCYATFFEDNTIVIYQQHCLERFAERVLLDNTISPKDVMYKHIIPNQNSSFIIVLPSPKYKFDWYHAAANALFLGDFDHPTKKQRNLNGAWINTCISFNEAHITQYKIMETMHQLQEFVSELGFDPIRDKSRFETIKRRLLLNKEMEVKVKAYFKKTYLLFQLSFDYPYIKELFSDENTRSMDYCKNILHNDFSYSIEELSPYDEVDGVARQGEIDYQGQ